MSTAILSHVQIVDVSRSEVRVYYHPWPAHPKVRPTALCNDIGPGGLLGAWMLILEGR
jgi:hypothetical protein